MRFNLYSTKFDRNRLLCYNTISSYTDMKIHFANRFTIVALSNIYSSLNGLIVKNGIIYHAIEIINIVS